jgi:Ras-related protein Rab-2A
LRADSFQHVANWLVDGKSAARKDCSICVVGNKSDLKDTRAVKYNDGAKFCQDNGMII